jgi:hypothetical protein
MQLEVIRLSITLGRELQEVKDTKKEVELLESLLIEKMDHLEK